MTPASEKNPAAVQTAGLEIAIQRQREGSADPGEGNTTTAAGAVDKAAPIPADVLTLAQETAKTAWKSYGKGELKVLIARAIMQDRADRASQEERIREDEQAKKLEAAVRLTVADASHHLQRFRPHCLAALRSALSGDE